MKLRLILLAVLLAAVAAMSLAWAQTVDFAGENLVYEFGWSGISAATAKVTVKPITDAGAPCYKIVFEIKGKPKLDWIWKVRDRIETITTRDSLQCHRFFFQQREARFHLDTDVRLDPAKQMLLSSRTRYKQGEAQALKPKHAPSNHYDPVSALYFARRAPKAPGKVYNLKVFDGKRKHDLTYSVIAEERIKIGLGEFDAWKIWPRIVRSSGADAASKVNKVRNAYLWVDKKPPHHVLKIESDVFVGAIYAELIQQ